MNLDDEIDEDDESEDSDGKAKGPVSIVDKIKALLNKKSLKKNAKSEPAKAGGKKAIISKPIAAVLLIGVVAFLFGDQIFPPEPETPAVDPMVAKIEAKRKQRKADKKASAAAAAAAGGGTNTAVTEPTTDPTTPGETPTTDTTTEVPPVDTTTTAPDITPTEPIVTDPVVTEPTIDTPTDSTPIDTAPVDTAPVDTTTVDTVDPDTTTTGTDENMTDKILEDLEKQVKESTPRAAVTTYVAPPDYEYRGRGLVYNCVGKHWACVDGPSYKVCEDNASGTKFLKKRNECYPFNVYQTQSGCEKTQNRMVSSGSKTNFCNE